MPPSSLNQPGFRWHKCTSDALGFYSLSISKLTWLLNPANAVISNGLLAVTPVLSILCVLYTVLVGKLICYSFDVIPLLRKHIHNLYHPGQLFVHHCLALGNQLGCITITNLIPMVGDKFGCMEYRVDLVLMGELESEINWSYLLNNVIWTKVLG